MSVDIANLSKRFQHKTVVDGLTFRVEKGEILGLLGPNGAGKSTTMKMLTGYLQPSQGEIYICGYDFNKEPLKAKKHIGYLPEHSPLYLEMYVHEYLQLMGSMYPLTNRERTQRVQWVIEQCAIGDIQTKKLGVLSKGYRQRVGLAQALLHDPTVLILDEPTTGLDPNQLQAIRQVIRELGKEKAIIFSTHIMQEVEAVCSHVAIMHQGQVRLSSTLQALHQRYKNQFIISFREVLPVELPTSAQVHFVQKIDPYTYILAVDSSDTYGTIFQFVQQHGLIIQRLEPRKEHLEAIFTQITKTVDTALIAYVIIAFFLIVAGLWVWVLPETNVLDTGYADLSVFFQVAPYLFMLLAPAITMGFFADELRSGTLELLLTRPLTPLQISLGKYFASLTIILVILLFTSVYGISLYYLAAPIGNIDIAALVGSYIGLLLLAALFLSIGLSASILTKNQIVAFLLGTFICFLLYQGMDAWSMLHSWKSYSLWLAQLGMHYHYASLRRGVIDLSDVLYFISMSSLFILFTSLVLNRLVAYTAWRIDLTQDHRYSLHPATKQLLRQLEAALQVDVYLSGDLPNEFKQLQKSTLNLLEEFKAYTKFPINYRLIDLDQESPTKRKELLQKLIEKQIEPTNLQRQSRGQRIERLVYPGILLAYQGKEAGIMLLKANKMTSTSQMVTQSISNLEYEFAKTLTQLAQRKAIKIGLVRGHGEPNEMQLQGLVEALKELYEVQPVVLSQAFELANYQALFITQPQQAFTEAEKYVLDQYIMQGGKALFFIDQLNIHMDDLKQGPTTALPLKLNLDDLLFRYGVKINTNLIQDLQAGVYPMVVGKVGNQPQIQLLPWSFFPIINHFSDHIITKNINPIYAQFISSIDPVKVADVSATPLLYSSPRSIKVNSPVYINLTSLRTPPDPTLYNQGPLPVAFLLEGTFKSLYKNRIPPAGCDAAHFLETSNPTKILVVASGSLVCNTLSPKEQTFPWGYDPFLQQNFANPDFVLNALAYISDQGNTRKIVLATHQPSSSHFAANPIRVYQVHATQKEVPSKNEQYLPPKAPFGWPIKTG
eukprot:gene313-402_t